LALQSVATVPPCKLAFRLRRAIGDLWKALETSSVGHHQGMRMTPQQFIAKWQQVNLSERSACQQHFLDLCDLLNQPKPAEAEPPLRT
jgi:hypothetical protein